MQPEMLQDADFSHWRALLWAVFSGVPGRW
jgi:hypothetical protein